MSNHSPLSVERLGGAFCLLGNSVNPSPSIRAPAVPGEESRPAEDAAPNPQPDYHPTPSVSSPVHPQGWARALSSPIRLLQAIVHQPVKAFLIVAAVGLLIFGVLAVADYVQFRRHLAAGREATERWHNYAAIRHLSACRALRPDNSEVLLLATRVARRMSEWGEAERLLNRYEEVHGETEDLVFERVLYRATRGDTDSTAAALEVRIRRGGAEARLAREALILGLVAQFHHPEARAGLSEWLAESPDDPVAVFLDGKLKVEEGGTDQAVAAFQRALELDPDLEEARLQLGFLLVSKRRGAEAIPVLKVLREQLPDHPEVQVLWVKALALVGRSDESRAALEECLRQHPDYPGALAERGSFAITDGDEPLAVDYLQRAVRQDPANLGARNQLAFALTRVGRQTEAQKQYDAIKQLTADSDRITALVQGALQEDPNNPSIHREIGMIALRSGDTREALRWFHSALRVDPNHLPTHRTLAAVYQELQNPVLAAKHRAIAQRLTALEGKH